MATSTSVIVDAVPSEIHLFEPQPIAFTYGSETARAIQQSREALARDDDWTAQTGERLDGAEARLTGRSRAL